MKKIFKVLVMVCCLLTTISHNVKSVDAASASASVSVSASTVTAGNTFTITFSASCSDSENGAAVAQATVTFNSSYLSLIGPPSDYNDGTLVMDFTKNGSATFKFSTLASGSTTITFQNIRVISYKDGECPVNTSISKTITINPKTTGGGGGGTSSNTGGGYSGGSNTSTPALSADATVASIVVEGQELMPKFSSDVTEYKLYLPKGTTTLKVNAKAASSKSKIESINSDVKPGWNDIKVTCTAENKSQKTYTLKAYVEEEPDRFFKLNDTELGIVKNLDLVEPLEGFEKVEIEANIEGVDGKVPLTIFKGGYFNLLYL